MKLEEQLIKEYGRRRPFKVPENYFGNFVADFVNKLPERQVRVVKISAWKRYRTMVAAAACFIGLAIMSGTYLYMNTPEQQGMSALKSASLSASTSRSTFDQAADYMMVDSDDMYSYLAEY